MKAIKEPKNKVLVSFSGGETSAYMINWLLLNKPNKEYYYVFANTGEENEETLLFVKQVSEYFKINVIWLEYDRLSFKIVDYKTAYRSHSPKEIVSNWKNHPFRKYIEDFMIPNVTNNSCSRELKEYIIRRYVNSLGLKPRHYDIAIGIRADEVNRIGNHYYPLLANNINKQMVNAFWNNMPFRLQIKGYEGNCKTCWKKSFRKLVTIARESPEKFGFFAQMEKEFTNHVKETQAHRIKPPIRFFRGKKTVSDIMAMAKDLSIENAIDDKLIYNYQISMFSDGTELDMSNGCTESCDAFN